MKTHEEILAFSDELRKTTNTGGKGRSVIDNPYPLLHECRGIIDQLLAEREWRAVVGWEDSYEVNSWGCVRKKDGPIIGQWYNDQGYALARLSNPRSMVRVHRLVAEAFVANPNNLPCVNHKDFNPANNEFTNLEWCTQTENVAYSRNAGRYPDNYWKGKRGANALLDLETANKIRQEYKPGVNTHASLGEKYGVSKSAIGRILRNVYYKIPLPQPPSNEETSA